MSEQAVVTGRVTNTENHPVAAAEVRIQELALGSITNLDGTYRLVVPNSRLNSGYSSYTMTASKLGSVTSSAVVTLGPGSNLTKNFVLSPVGRGKPAVLAQQGVSAQLSSAGPSGEVKLRWVDAFEPVLVGPDLCQRLDRAEASSQLRTQLTDQPVTIVEREVGGQSVSSSATLVDVSLEAGELVYTLRPNGSQLAPGSLAQTSIFVRGNF